MAKIPLRVYLKEIDNLIERGEIEQAVAHAKNILRSYPKNIDTYRLLGKAYLESQHYSEAADILQRVLSVIPDDFISQIGMSIIREDEGNLDAAIWHMERAYEVQPFNPAVQEELRRLYGRRDGAEPPKIRLTRGALVRMYERGELYPQAIAETRAALAEDPERQDLLVLLARLYHVSGHVNDAAEVCSELIHKLPYCLEANRLLAEILPTTSRAEEAKVFQQRIYALDPYEAYTSPNALTADQVSDQAVMVEQFMLDEAAESAQAPEWARNVGVEWEETKEEALPDWLNTLKPEQAASKSAAPAEEEPPSASTQTGEMPEAAAPTQDELVPDWMKEAGWAATDRKADDIMAEQGQTGVEETGEEEIVQADIPDWLQSMAPPEASQPDEIEAERTEWLDNLLIQPTGTNGKETATPPTTEPEAAEPEQLLPDWTAGLESSAAEETTAPEASLPDWLSQISEEDLPREEGQPGEEYVSSAEELPSLSMPDETLAAGPEQPSTGEEVPDWLSTLGEEQPAETAAPAEGAPDWLSTLAEEHPEEPAAPTDETPDWLKSFASEVETPAVEDLPAAKNQLEEPLAAEELPSAEMQPGAQIYGETEQPEETPDWLSALAAADATTEADQPAVEESLPEWLQNAEPEAAAPDAQPEEIAHTIIEEPAAEETTQTIIEEPVAETKQTIIEEPPAAVETLTAGEAVPDFNDMDAAMAWLESLAAKQGADEATLVTPPEQRLEQPPEWVTKEIETEIETAEAALPPNPVDITEPEETPVEAVAETFVEAAPAEAAPVESAPIQPEAEKTQPIRVHRATVETPPAEAEPPAAEAVTPPIEAKILPVEEAPAAVQGSEPGQPDTEAPVSAIAEPGEVEPAVPDFSDMDAAMAWLESLAAKQGADEATLVTSPEQRLEQPPEWVIHEIESQPVSEEHPLSVPEETPVLDEAAAPVEEAPEGTAEPEVLEPAGEEAIPDWLKESMAGIAEETEPAQEEPAAPTPEMVETEQVKAVETPAEQAPAAEAPAAEMNMDDTFAWLESLAARQGAQEGTLITAPEERPEVQPESDFAYSVEAAELPEAEEPPVTEAPAEAEIPEWLQGVEANVIEEEAAVTSAEETLPDWLQSIGEEEPQVQPRAEEMPEAEAQPASAEQPEAIEQPQIPEVSAEIPAAEELPVAEQPAEEAPAAEEAIPEWLAGIEPAAPEKGTQEPEETIPDWLKGLGEESESEAAFPVTTPPSSSGDFRSAWEPEVEINQPVAESTGQDGTGLADIQAALNRGDLDTALAGYSRLVQNGENLNETIHDLRDALYRYPVDIAIWQILGDAYARNDQLQDALDAYTKAEELLR